MNSAKTKKIMEVLSIENLILILAILLSGLLMVIIVFHPWTLTTLRYSENIYHLILRLMFIFLGILILITLYLLIVSIHRLIKMKQTDGHRIYHNRVTGIENKAFLFEKLNPESYLGPAMRMTLLYIRIDDLKNIINTFGYGFSDNLLINISQILKNNIDDPLGKLIHLCDDEFACLIPDYDLCSVFEVIQNIRRIFTESISCCDRNVFVTISIGVSTYPDHGEDFDTLLKCADSAMRDTKVCGKGTLAFYDPISNQITAQRLKIEQQLRGLTDYSEFSIVFQPQVCPRSTTIRGFEALLRWNSKELGLVDTAELIDIAEDTGLIVPLGDWIIREACDMIGSINKRCKTSYTLAINVSPLQLQNPEFVNKLKAILSETEFDPNLLEIEITENILIHQKDNEISENLEELYRMGVRSALDDFGTGYSSLSYLNKLPIQTLKIDRDFIISHSNPKTRSMIESIITMAHKLDLYVIAEGVEKKEELSLLKLLGCDFIQGYYYSKPLPYNEIPSILSMF